MDLRDGLLVSARALLVRFTFSTDAGRSASSLKKCNSTSLFEDNQANLEQAVENLSGLLAKPIDAERIDVLRADMTNQTAFVQKRSDIIMQDTLMGHYKVSR